MSRRQHWIVVFIASSLSCAAQESPLSDYVFHKLEPISVPLLVRSDSMVSLNRSVVNEVGNFTSPEIRKTTDKSSISYSCNSTEMPPEEVKALVEKVAREEGFDEKMAVAVARQESRFNVRSLSPKGAIGIMQLMPDTAKMLGVDPCNVEQNIRGGVRYLKDLESQFKNPIFYLAAYNAGPKRVRDNGGVPPIHETVNYVAAIINDYHGWERPRATARTATAKARDFGPGVVARAEPAGWKSGFVMNLDE